MAGPQRYRFFPPRTAVVPLVLRDGVPFPDGTAELQWELTRVRDAADVNTDVRGEIAAKGDCLFAIGLTLDAIKRTQPE